ncbi:MAG: hypothetical protein ACTS8S_19590 [Giesbergeria sp.]
MYQREDDMDFVYLGMTALLWMAACGLALGCASLQRKQGQRS